MNRDGKSPEPAPLKNYANRALQYGHEHLRHARRSGRHGKEVKTSVVFRRQDGEEITRSVLSRLFSSRKAKGRICCRSRSRHHSFYGDVDCRCWWRYSRNVVGDLTREQARFRESIGKPSVAARINLLEDQCAEHEMFEAALTMFLPFAQKTPPMRHHPRTGGGRRKTSARIEEHTEMQKRLDR